MKKYEEDLLEAIHQDVRSNAEMITARVNEETELLMNDQIDFFLEGLKKETDTYLETELNELRSNEATLSSRGKMDTKKKLFELRAKLMDELFQEVHDELVKFVSSDEYDTYLTKHLEDISISDKGYFVVRKNDVTKMKKLLQNKNLKNEVREGYFAIGGFIYVDEENGMEYSCVLKEKMEEQKSWFRDHSGLKVKEGI